MKADALLGHSPAMLKIRELLLRAAETEATVLLLGEMGTGKEMAARILHTASPRAGGPFIAVNCAAIPDTLIESELFGHEKGAFTGAVATRQGKFMAARGGTLFLDEIGELSPGAQAKLLRVIQEGAVEKLGGETEEHVNARLIAATNRDLAEDCKSGRFREDLYYRLNVIPVRMPPLRERTEDIHPILTVLLGGLGVDCEMNGDALEYLASYPWPGNVRELQNLAERIALMYCPGHPGLSPTKADLEILLTQKGEDEKKSEGSVREDLRKILDLGYNEAKAAFEKQYLEHQYEKNSRSVPKTAEAVGLTVNGLSLKLKKYRIR